MKRLVLMLILWTWLPAMAASEPVRYVLDRDRSKVGFTVQTGQQDVSGSFPIREAEVLLDFERNRGSVIRVVLDATGARTNLPFATQAIRSREMLDTRQHPTMRFASRELTIGQSAATLSGDMTIRGVTRPVRLNAQVFRQRGSAAGDLSRLSVQVTGTVRRSDFGVTGLPDMVDENIRLNILVRLDRAGG